MEANAVKRSATIRNAGPLFCLASEGREVIMSREGPQVYLADWLTGRQILG